jgi:DNA-binding transcriptional ArsR family regulator
VTDHVPFEPESIIVVSDLGQIQAFVDPVRVRILRVFQRQEATASEMASIVGLDESTVTGAINSLVDLKLVRTVGQRERENVVEDAYRATARIFDVQPEPAHNHMVMAPVAEATLNAVVRDVVASLKSWPDQKMNYEGRRRRLSITRALEFDQRLNELLAEYWGDPEEPVDEDGQEPVMAFSGIWYRSPDTT